MAAEADKAVIYHNPRCSTSRKTLDLLRENDFEPRSPFGVTQKGTRLARPIDAVREIL
jgi:arsenate reductase-like glutaredoxin family protein